MSETALDFARLDLQATIGFGGSVPSGLKVHPREDTLLIYPLGNTVVIKNTSTNKQEFLSGHTDNVSCITLSKSGKYIASGQVTHMGFMADIIIWDFERRELYCKLSLHKVKVEALAFSASDQYLISLGGQDDGSVVVWNVATKSAICGSPAQVESAGPAQCVACGNLDDNLFVTGGLGTLRVWELEVQNRKIRPTDVAMGQHKRQVKCIQIAPDDKYFYCGTSTGDILGVLIKTKMFQLVGPTKNKFSLGVTALTLYPDPDLSILLVGAGDGTVCLVERVEQSSGKQKPTQRKIAGGGKQEVGEFKRLNRETKVNGAVTSIALRGRGHQFYVGTDQAHTYRFIYNDFIHGNKTHDLLTTCHFHAVNDIAFPANCSDLFATCSKEDVRVWQTEKSQELLRITVKNKICTAIDFPQDGTMIITAWDDGKIRGFAPQSGKEMFTIEDAHNKGVTAIATTSDSQCIVSGGGEGQVRVWSVGRSTGSKGLVFINQLLSAMKEHKASVTCIKINKLDNECVTASTDGTCIIWSLRRFVRNQIIFANTLFKCVCYNLGECQIIASGTDRKIGYWEVSDGSLIRELDGSMSGEINGMDIDPNGKYMVTGGQDKLIRLWEYDTGEVAYVGVGHSSPINKVKICPERRYIISVSDDGAVLRWGFPSS